LWAAKNYSSNYSRSHVPFVLLCLWAWYSERFGTLGHELIARKWNPKMDLNCARTAAYQWLTSISLAFYLSQKALLDTWHKPGRVDGFRFEPVANASDIRNESSVLRNCVKSYGARLAGDRSRLWSGRPDDGTSLAMLEMRREEDNPVPYLWQIKAAENRRASAQIWLAAQKWLSRQKPLEEVPRPSSRNAPLDRDGWTRLWRPYWLAKRHIPPWLYYVHRRRPFLN